MNHYTVLDAFFAVLLLIFTCIIGSGDAPEDAGLGSHNRLVHVPTSDVLKNFGLEKELERVSKKSIRAGRGKTRGRKYKIKKGPLLIVSKQSDVIKAVSNIPGIDIVNVKNLNVEMLAPGEVPGRLTLWTVSAIENLEKEKLFR